MPEDLRSTVYKSHLNMLFWFLIYLLMTLQIQQEKEMMTLEDLKKVIIKI